MSRVRNDVVDWAEEGLIPPDAIRDALRITRVTPTASDWRVFLDRVALWLGVIFLAFGAIFFFAFNWASLGRFAKFGLVEAPLLAAIFLAYRLRLDNFKGKALLLGATLLVGALLALVGQTYQTGADAWELFAVWALAVTPWAVVGCFGALWLLWVGLLNLALWFYFHKAGGSFFATTGHLEKMVWSFFALNTVALVLWEAAAMRFEWLRERWPVRIVAVASGGLATTLGIWGVVDVQHAGAQAVAYIGWIIGAYAVYRHVRRDLFVLAAGALSLIVVVTALMVRGMISGSGSAGGLLFIGLVIIGMSAMSAMWLKSVAAEDQS